MRRHLLSLLAVATLAAAFATGAEAAKTPAPVKTTGTTAQAQPRTLTLTPIERVPFPDRGFVVDLPKNVALDPNAVDVVENGVRIGDFVFSPLSASGLGFGAILAIDASDSMHGDPYTEAVSAAQNFVTKRGRDEWIGLVAFNGGVHVVQKPTLVKSRLDRALAHPPALGFGTRIYDAITRSLALIRSAKLSTGSIVLLSDGSDFGSKTSLKATVAQAKREHVRVFTVGLRSKAFDSATLRSIAEQTGGSYAEAGSPQELARIYSALSSRLAREYVLQYRSLAAPKSKVDVKVSVSGFGTSTASYVAPTPSGFKPYHRSVLDRFLLSPLSLLLLALVVACLLIYVIHQFRNRPQSAVVGRVQAFAVPDAGTERRRRERERAAQVRATAVSAARRTEGFLASLGRDMEIAEMEMAPGTLVLLTVLGTLLVILVLVLISPIVAVLGLLTPFISRAVVRVKLKRVHDRFSEQLPTNLQVLASALRAGHSFSGALSSVVEQAQEPSRREFRRVVADDQLGVPMDEALRRVADRMASRDLEQVALVAELHRTTGGNIAEVLDVVVGTIRDRQDVRRLLKTLTAQGRMARWILTGLPIVTGLGFYAIQPSVAGPFYGTSVGQVVLVFAALCVAAGSFVIQRIVEIEI